MAFDRWKSCCLSSSNFVFCLSRVPKCKNNFCKSIPTFAHLMCEPCFADVCVCFGVFGDMVCHCILQELSPVLTGESNEKQHVSFRGRES